MNFVLPEIDLGAIAPQLWLTATAILVLMVQAFVPLVTSRSLALLSIIGSLLSLVATLGLWGQEAVLFSGMIALDTFSLFFNVVFLLGAILTVLISVEYLEREQIAHGEYFALVLFATVGMMIMAAGVDLIAIFIGLEILSLSLYVLAGFMRQVLRSNESAMKYFLLGAFATGFFLYGIALLYGATGSTNLDRIFLIAGERGGWGNVLVMGGMGLLLVGFGFKVASVPFHMWTPDVYEGAPTPISAFMSTAAKAGAFAAFVRVFLYSLPGLAASWAPLLAGMAVLSMVVGTLLALVQRRNIKRLLAYSSIVHVGYLLLGLLSGGTEGGASVLFYLLAYTFMQVGAFAVVVYLGGQGEDDLSLARFSGVAVRHPVAALAFSLFLLSLAGIPPTAGFVGKFYIFSAAIQAGHIGLAVVGVLTSVVSLYYYLGVIVFMYMRDPVDLPERRPSAALVTALALAVAGTVEMGLFPGSLLDLAQQSVASLLGS
ncbi:MAG: NADH-quinone oxidoreductase subunit N [Candidatus Tectomicrobia bacterium]|uniref:NADH-quinone oxidoreductase subunit N n=1 Tax=Tectimicrobiota bacterium TaxID=2528274 RepID=A0A932GN13_UNCTE|nr:NADH-quinone oxidoreductase subunit N [Candidatus Tectomicrobia bacterium]